MDKVETVERENNKRTYPGESEQRERKKYRKNLNITENSAMRC